MRSRRLSAVEHAPTAAQDAGHKEDRPTCRTRRAGSSAGRSDRIDVADDLHKTRRIGKAETNAHDRTDGGAVGAEERATVRLDAHVFADHQEDLGAVHCPDGALGNVRGYQDRTTLDSPGGGLVLETSLSVSSTSNGHRYSYGNQVPAKDST